MTTEPPGFPPTRNPWDTSLSAGGSSGGSAAAVAAGIVAVAHGSDATGSLRCPAALCGVTTLCPTAGTVDASPPAGQSPNAAWRSFVLARHVEDLVDTFARLTGRSGAPEQMWRVGLLDHDPEFGLPVDPACRDGVAVAGRLLESLGHAVEPVWPQALAGFWTRAAEPVAVLTDAARLASLDWLAGRLGRPVRGGELEPEVFAAADRARRRTTAEFASANDRLHELVTLLTGWWDGFDLLVTPTTFRTHWPLGGSPGPAEVGTLLAPFSLAGQPSMSLPLHRDHQRRPVGVHLVARHGADLPLLRLAADLQQLADWTAHRPPCAAM